MNSPDLHLLLAFQVRSLLVSISVIFSLKKHNALLAFGFLASQEVKDTGVGNLGLWDRECLANRHDQCRNAWLHRAHGT